MPGLLELFILMDINLHLSSDFLAILSDPSVGVFSTRFPSFILPGQKSSLCRAESCAGRETDLH